MAQGSSNPSVAAALLDTSPELASVSPTSGDAGLVQRLDFETSGLLLLARSRAVWEKLRALSEGEKILKGYIALVEGRPEAEKVAHSWLGNPNRGAPRVRVYPSEPSPKARALPATTDFIGVQYHQEKDVGIVRAEFTVGRRHQVRAHAGSLSMPLLGDVKYGATRSIFEVFPNAGATPPFLLHGAALKLPHPETGELLSFEAPMPEPFRLIVEDIPGWHLFKHL